MVCANHNQYFRLLVGGRKVVCREQLQGCVLKLPSTPQFTEIIRNWLNQVVSRIQSRWFSDGGHSMDTECYGTFSITIMFDPEWASCKKNHNRRQEDWVQHFSLKEYCTKFTIFQILKSIASNDKEDPIWRSTQFRDSIIFRQYKNKFCI